MPTCCTWSEDVTGASDGTVGCDGGGPSAGGCEGSMDLGDADGEVRAKASRDGWYPSDQFGAQWALFV